MTDADKNVTAAWRAASREEPPRALDDTIRAAARREVGARPRRAGAAPGWWPLAAAATVAVLAIGIVEMTPTERVPPEIAADMRPAPMANKVEAAESPPPAQTTASVESDRNAPSSPLAEKPAKLQAPTSALRKENPARPPQEQVLAALRERADTSRRASAEGGFAKPGEREPKQKADLANTTTAAAATGSADASSAALSRSVPFPAASPARDKLDQAQAAAPAPSVAAESRPAPALPAQSQPAPPPSVPSAGANAPAAPAPVARMSAAKPATGEIKREADAQLRPTDEWIKLMRRLIAEGKPTEAAKELAAFRAAYKDRADALLPSDLREFKP